MSLHKNLGYDSENALYWLREDVEGVEALILGQGPKLEAKDGRRPTLSVDRAFGIVTVLLSCATRWKRHCWRRGGKFVLAGDHDPTCDLVDHLEGRGPRCSIDSKLLSRVDGSGEKEGAEGLP